MTETNTDIITYHVTLPTTKFDVNCETNQAKKESLFIFKVHPFPLFNDYFDLNHHCKRALDELNSSTENIQHATNIDFQCDQAVNVQGITYPGFIISIHKSFDSSDGELTVDCNTRPEDQYELDACRLTIRPAKTLEKHFTDKLVDIYRQHFNEIKQTRIISFLKTMRKRILSSWTYEETRLTTALAEEARKRDTLIAQTKQHLDQYLLSVNSG